MLDWNTELCITVPLPPRRLREAEESRPTSVQQDATTVVSVRKLQTIVLN